MRNYLAYAKARRLGWDIRDLCAAYSWPKQLGGKGVIGIYEAAGGWTAGDLQKFFTAIGQPMPAVTDVSVDDTTNMKQSPRSDADVEVALDIQVAAASFFIATGRPANIRVYWGQDIAEAIVAAMSDGCDVFSISWGNDEAAWGSEACQQIATAAAAATARGMVILAAAGDNDSGDGGPSPANVDCPASCPSVIACGGTSLQAVGAIETVWNNNPGRSNGEGTGGGYSTIFPAQAFQIGAPPAPAKEPGLSSPGRGRMVPDVAANADPDDGYRIVVYGQDQIIGGTSAVAPLYAGLFAAMGEKLGAIAPKLWQNAAAFRDITSGNNGEFSARIGPDPCTGLGSPNGLAIAALFSTPASGAHPADTDADLLLPSGSRVQLGRTVRDKITGFTGVVIGKVQYLTGCSQALVQPECETAKRHAIPESRWLDEDRLYVDEHYPAVVIDVHIPGPCEEAPRK